LTVLRSNESPLAEKQIDKIRVTITGLAAQFIPLQLAQKRGILKAEGLDAEIVQMWHLGLPTALQPEPPGTTVGFHQAENELTTHSVLRYGSGHSKR
jgi:hypothetical protein